MKFLKSFILVGTLMSMLGGCYVHERHHPRYAARTYCAYGHHWDGYRCRRNW